MLECFYIGNRVKQTMKWSEVQKELKSKNYPHLLVIDREGFQYSCYFQSKKFMKVCLSKERNNRHAI